MRKYVVFSNYVEPVHEGVYQRQLLVAGKPRWMWAKFVNRRWRLASADYSSANLMRGLSGYQRGDVSGLPGSTLNWRGLARKPEVK